MKKKLSILEEKFVIILDYIFHSSFLLFFFAHSSPPHTTFFLFIFILFFAIAINNQFHKSDSLTHSLFVVAEKMVKILMPYKICEMLERFFVLRWKKSMQRLGKKERNRSFLRYISHKVITFKCYCCCYFHFLLFSRSLALSLFPFLLRTLVVYGVFLSL